jgi:hypothetical protein
MTLQEQKEFFSVFTEMMGTIMLSKGDDYAGEDRLSNFKKAGSICGLSAEMNCLNLIATKVARMGNLLSSSKPPSNEALRDTCLDGANYFLLLAMLLQEKTPVLSSCVEITTTPTGTYSNKVKGRIHYGNDRPHDS